MALLDELPDVPEAYRNWVVEVDSSLRFDAEEYVPYFNHYIDDLGVDVDYVIRDISTPPLGVHAVCLALDEGEWRPALLVMRGLGPGSEIGVPVPSSEFPSLRDALERFGGLLDLNSEIDPSNVGVIEIDPPREQYEIVQGDLRGTLGLPVRSPTGERGAFTAGHVARTVGTTVTLVRSEIAGQVAYSDHRGRHTDESNCADVAFIALPRDWQDNVPVPQGLRLSGAQDELRMLRAIKLSGAGDRGVPVRTVGDRFFVRQNEGCWGDFIMADSLSEEGDSGSMAIDERGHVAGQVVGGFPHVYSIAQNIRYLLESADVVPDVSYP